MKIKSTPQRSIAGQLEDILNSTLPQTAVTGLNKDLSHIRNDPKGKGKSVLFSWRKSTYRLTENLKVTELDFTNSYVANNDTMGIELMIEAKINPISPEPAIPTISTESEQSDTEQSDTEQSDTEQSDTEQSDTVAESVVVVNKTETNETNEMEATHAIVT